MNILFKNINTLAQAIDAMTVFESVKTHEKFNINALFKVGVNGKYTSKDKNGDPEHYIYFEMIGIAFPESIDVATLIIERL